MARRWWVAAAGTALMACLGTVNGWSLFARPLADAFGWSAARTTVPFATAVFFLGVGAIVGGRWQDRAGPRPVAVTGALLWGLANLAAGLGTQALGWGWLVATYGVVGGLGLGFGYVTPVATVTKWFPGRRGLGSSLVVMGFALGAVLYAMALGNLPALAPGAPRAALLSVFSTSGAVYLAVGGAAAALLRNPPAGPLAQPSTPPTAAATPTGLDLPPAEALRRPQFWSLWAMLFLNVTAGLLFISNAVPILGELTGVTARTAAAAFGGAATANVVGRVLWGAVSDRIGRRATWALLFGIQAPLFIAARHVHALPAAVALFAAILLCFGGGFATMPSFVADWFGTRHLGVNYGWILTAWGVAGVAGPLFVATVKDRTGSFAHALPWIGAVLAVATLLPVVTRRPSSS